MGRLKTLIFVSASLLVPTVLTVSAAAHPALLDGSISSSATVNSTSNQASNSPAPYCLALRGNGESEPSHWGALANLVEKVGLPRAQSGGSSASITLFLLENIAANHAVSQANPDDQKVRAALLLKSLYGMADYIARTKQATAALDLWKSSSKTMSLYHSDKLALLKKIAGSANLQTLSATNQEVHDVLNTLQEMGIGSTPRYVNLFSLIKKLLLPYKLSIFEIKELKFYATDLLKALSTFGAFDAESDSGLFLRDGIIDFRKFAFQIGKIATLLNGRANDDKTQASFDAFVNLCAPLHRNLTWQELVAKEKNCETFLDATLDSFFAQNLDWNSANVILQKVDTGVISSFPSTAVLTDAPNRMSAYKEAKQAYDLYHNELDRSVAANFKIDHQEDIKFGYWGDLSTLQKIQQNLQRPFDDGLGRHFNFSHDAKSAKFLPIGSATWLDILSLSPAEPGLSAIQPMMINGQPAYSAGGWADLHPVLILKAAGCDNVVYVTRKGGESMFGQGVAKRLLGLNRPWEKLRTSDPVLLVENKKLNVLGDPQDMTSTWSLLYNVANPKSSYMRSTAIADAVVCTDWDHYDVFSEGILDLVTESYHAPIVLPRPTIPSGRSIIDDLITNGAQIVQNPRSKTNGLPDWVGCRGTIR